MHFYPRQPSQIFEYQIRRNQSAVKKRFPSPRALMPDMIGVDDLATAVTGLPCCEVAGVAQFVIAVAAIHCRAAAVRTESRKEK